MDKEDKRTATWTGQMGVVTKGIVMILLTIVLPLQLLLLILSYFVPVRKAVSAAARFIWPFTSEPQAKQQEVPMPVSSAPVPTQIQTNDVQTKYPVATPGALTVHNAARRNAALEQKVAKITGVQLGEIDDCCTVVRIYSRKHTAIINHWQVSAVHA